ncbi:MAG: hypothetical protein B7733_10695 [Myxococcales bacterium FL481]|nr:MAG: hypothetical protein B7733_10695 [Myxococcales bacterium FL481]
MFLFGSAAATQTPQFVPNAEARGWISESLAQLYQRLHPSPHAFVGGDVPTPRDIDGLFELLCGLQREVDQADVEFSLQEGGAEGPPLPAGFAPLGDAKGHLLHTFAKAGEYVLVYLPQLFRVPELALASVARELGRIAIDRVGGLPEPVDDHDREGFVELAAVTLGMGVWVANGAYVFEQKCCGGGCGVDLGSVRAGLSMPEACFAVALDGRARDRSRRTMMRGLSPTQAAAFKSSWKWIGREGSQMRALVSSASTGAIAD